MRRVLAAGIITAIAVSACGKSETQKQAEEAAQQIQKAADQAKAAAEDVAKSSGDAADDAAKGFAAMAKGLEAMASGGADGKTVDPVSFRDLIPLLPDLDGWEKTKPEGERVTAPFKYSTASVNYTRGDSRIEVKLADSGFNQLLFAPFAMAMQMGYEKETTDGYEKSTKLRGQPAFEKWDSESKDGEVTMIVGNRFLVTIEADDVADASILQDVVNRIDVDRLAALK